MSKSLDIAQNYRARGWHPVPVPYRKKGPTDKEWDKRNLTEDTLPQYFNGAAQNVGVQLGAKSQGLTDVDLDCPEAVKLARYLLPPTNSIFGRASKPRSHFLYYISDAIDKGSLKLTDVAPEGRKGAGACIIELRMGGGAKGAQTVFPGSTHDSGEAIEWAQDVEPAISSFAVLKMAITKIAVATILIRAFPATKGSRHDAALALGGFLARAGWDINDIELLAEAVARLGGSGDPAARAKDAVAAAESYKRGEKVVYGLPGLIDFFGEEPAKRVAKYLEYGDKAPGWLTTAQSQSLGSTTDWRERGKGGIPIASMHNARVAITALGIECSYDIFHTKMLFGFRDDAVRYELGGEMSDNAVIRLRQIISVQFGFDPKEQHTRDAVISLALDHCFDPVCDLIDKAQAEWDGEERLDRMAADYFNCEDTPLNRAFVRKMMIALVHRARVPGCKFDNIVVLESLEGWNKSSAFNVLAGDENFSDESILGAKGREVQEQLSAVWIHENADLAGMRKAEVEHVKAFASRTTDIARGAYGHFVTRQKRHSIEVGTTNGIEYLQSQDGNRRFWPLKLLKRIDLDKLRRDRLQLIGEAAKYEQDGESVTLPETLWSVAGEAQEQRRTKDLWEDLIDGMAYVGTILSDGTIAWNAVIHFDPIAGQERVATSDILDTVLQIPPGQQNREHAMRLKNVMKQLGWLRDGENKITIGRKQVRGYYRPAGKAVAAVQTMTVQIGSDADVGGQAAGMETVYRDIFELVASSPGAGLSLDQADWPPDRRSQGVRRR